MRPASSTGTRLALRFNRSPSNAHHTVYAGQARDDGSSSGPDGREHPCGATVARTTDASRPPKQLTPAHKHTRTPASPSIIRILELDDSDGFDASSFGYTTVCSVSAIASPTTGDPTNPAAMFMQQAKKLERRLQS